MNTQEKKQNYSIKKQSQIKAAINKCDIKKLSQLLKKEETNEKDKKVLFSGLRACIKNIRNKLKYFEVIELLLNYISPFYIEESGNLESSNFFYAIKMGEIKLIRLFLSSIKNNNYMDPMIKKTLQKSIFICLKNFDENLGFFGQILNGIINETNISLDFEDENHVPPLQFAVRRKNVNLVKIILKGNCNVNYKNSKNENTALHLAAHQNDEELVRLLLKYDASVIVQNSKKMVPNGFTTNMNIIKLLNKKASEYENRTMRHRSRRNQHTQEIYTLRQPPNYNKNKIHSKKKLKEPTATKLKVHPKNTFTPDNSMPVPGPEVHKKNNNQGKKKQIPTFQSKPYNQQMIPPEVIMAPNPNNNIINEQYPPRHPSHPQKNGNMKKGNKYYSYKPKESFSLRGANESISSAPFRNKNEGSFAKGDLKKNSNLLNNLNNDAAGNMPVGVRRMSHQVHSDANPSNRGYQDFDMGENINFEPGANLRFNKQPNWPQSVRANGSLPNSPMIENPRLQINTNTQGINLLGPTPGTGPGALTPKATSIAGRNQKNKKSKNYHPGSMQTDIPYYPQNYQQVGQNIQYNNPNMPNPEMMDQMGMSDQIKQIDHLIKNSGDVNKMNNYDPKKREEGDRRPSGNTQGSSASDKEEMRERISKLKKVLAKKEKMERECYNEKEDLKREGRNLDFLYAKKMEVKKNNSNQCLDCPRLFNLKYYELNFTKKIQAILHEEALRFELQVDDLNEEQRPKLDEIVVIMKEIVKGVLPDAKLDLYGSFATGLCLPWSDIDIVLDIENDRCPSSYEALSAVEQALLERKDLFEEVKYISNAAFPVIKIVCTEKYLSKKLDITLQDERHNGLNCVDLVKEYLTEYDGLLKPIVFVVKHLLNLSELNDPYQGGMSSYGLILMIVALLQSCTMRGETVEYLRENLGRTLLEFLNTYGNLIDYSMIEVVPNLPSEKNPSPPFQQSQRLFNLNLMMNNNYYLSVVDPLNTNNNVTRSTHRYYVIRMIFSYAYLSVIQPCSCDFRNMISISKKKGLVPSMKEYFELKYGDNSTMEKWKVLIKIFNAYKSPVFLNYSNFSPQN